MPTPDDTLAAIKIPFAQVSEALRRLHEPITAAAQAIGVLARQKPILPYRRPRFGLLSPERAAALFPVGTVVQHYYLNLTGRVAPRREGGAFPGEVYHRDVSGWASVHVEWADGRAFSVSPRSLVAGDR